MNKIRTFYILFILATVVLGGRLYAQAPSWTGAVNLGATGFSSPGGVAADAAGSFYVTGSFTGRIPFGTHPLTGGGGTAMYIAKYSGGAWQWTRRVAALEGRYALAGDITVGADGNIYFLSTIDSSSGSIGTGSGDSTFTGPAGGNVVVGSYTAGGDLRWIRVLGTGKYKSGTSIVTTSTALHITGDFFGTLTSGERSVTTNGSNNIFIASFTLDGTPKGLISIGSSGQNRGIDLAVDSAERLYLLGYTFGSVMVGTISVPATNGDILLACFSKEGEAVWALHEGGADEHYNLTSLAVDPAGNSHISGTSTRGKAKFGGTPLPDGGSGDGFLARYDATGTFQWVKGLHSSGSDNVGSVGIDAAGNIYAYNTSLLEHGRMGVLAMYRPDGSLGWEQIVVGEDDNKETIVFSIAVAGVNDVYLYGTYRNSIRFGETLLENSNPASADIFIAHLGSGSGVKDVADQTSPAALEPIIPNPTGDAVSLRFFLRRPGHATLGIMDMAGSEVAVIADRNFPAGESSMTADLSVLPAGTYTAVLRSGSTVVSQRLVVVH